MANQYITTDESLEKFQAKFNMKNTNNESLRNIAHKVIKSAEGCQPFNQYNPTVLAPKFSKENASSKKAPIPKNIKMALEYYNLMES
jgi:hypothetical protein